MIDLIKFVKFKSGDLPLIISVPHGGFFKPKRIPKRIDGIHGIDKNTVELALNLIKEIKLCFSKKSASEKAPSYIFSLVHRSKIDFNREPEKAYMLNSGLAKAIYDFYHNQIKTLIERNLKIFGHSFLIDIHGFEKSKRPPGYRDVELILGTNNLASLYSDPTPHKEWGNNIRGNIIEEFLRLDIPIAPGHQKRREYVLTGGYITRKYGASMIPNSQTMQIEFSDKIRVHDPVFRSEVISSLALILHDQFKYTAELPKN